MGAFLFGLLADRYGRRLPLMIDLVFFSVCEVLTGLAPNYTTFLVLRALFGIGMGGEWGVGASLAMEKVPPRLRGMLSGLLQEGYAAGNLLAAIAYFFLFQRWGWRPLFFLGGLPALLALFVRFRVKESEVWKKSREESWSGFGRAIASHWKLFLYLTLLMTMMNFVSHGTQDMYPTFLERQWHFGPSQRSVMTGISMIGAILGGIVMGRLSDRYGRRRVMVGALLGGILMVPLWVYSPSTALLVLGAFLIQFMVQGAWGIIPAHLSELSPDSVRGFMPGFSYQCGVLVAGSVVYIEPILAKTHGLRHRHGPHRRDRFRARRDRSGSGQGAQGTGVRRRRMQALNDWRGARLQKGGGKARVSHSAGGWCRRCAPGLTAAPSFHGRR